MRDRICKRNPAGVKNFISRLHRLPVEKLAPVGHVLVGQLGLPSFMDQPRIPDAVIALYQNNARPRDAVECKRFLKESDSALGIKKHGPWLRVLQDSSDPIKREPAL